MMAVSVPVGVINTPKTIKVKKQADQDFCLTKYSYKNGTCTFSLKFVTLLLFIVKKILFPMYCKYLPPERKDVIEKLKIRFTQPGALNDPFEAVPLIKDDNDPNWQKRRPDLAARIGAQQIEIMGFTVGVLSLSRTKENLLLWTHYADEHRGYVIEFDENNEFFKANAEKSTCKPILVSYTSQRPIINMSDIKEFGFPFKPVQPVISMGHA